MKDNLRFSYKLKRILLVFLLSICVLINLIFLLNNKTELKSIETFQIILDFKKFVAILFEKNGFLIDNEYFSLPGKKTKLIAGVFNSSLKEFNEELTVKFASCNFNFGIGSNYNKNLVTGIFIDCFSFSVQILVFYVRNNFYWIGYVNKIFQFFGDKERALNLLVSTIRFNLSYRKRLISSSLFFHTCTSNICGVHARKKNRLLFKRFRSFLVTFILVLI